MVFYKLKDYDSIARMEPKPAQIMIEDYVMDVKKRVNPNSVPSFIYPLKSFFDANDLDLKWSKTKRLFPALIKKTGREAWSTHEIQKMLQTTTNLKNKAVIHFLASSGCRIGALPELKVGHVKEMLNGCKSVLIYEDSIEEYYTFLIPEASSRLDDYLEKRKSDGEYLDDDSPLFRKNYRIAIEKVRPTTKKALESIVLRATRKAGLRNSNHKKNGRHSKQLNHGFRKRFTTILKLNEKIPVAITERLLGHKMYYDEIGNKIQFDDSYMRATVNQLFEKFKFAIPDLTISDEERQQEIIHRQEQKITDFERKELRIKELEENQTRMWHKIEDMNKAKPLSEKEKLE